MGHQVGKARAEQALHTGQDEGPSSGCEHEGHDNTHNKGGDLTAGEGGDSGPNGEVGASHQKADKIGQRDGSIVRIAEIIDGDPHR